MGGRLGTFATRAALPAGAAVGVSAPTPAARSATPEMWTGIEIAADRMGQYQTEIRIDGFPVPVIVDTGATFLHLSEADARRIGLHLSDADYRHQAATANGMAAIAMTTLHEVQLGSIRLHDVAATVARGPALSKSLLGMSFLGRLSKVEAGGGRLILRP